MVVFGGGDAAVDVAVHHDVDVAVGGEDVDGAGACVGAGLAGEEGEEAEKNREGGQRQPGPVHPSPSESGVHLLAAVTTVKLYARRGRVDWPGRLVPRAPRPRQV